MRTSILIAAGAMLAMSVAEAQAAPYLYTAIDYTSPDLPGTSFDTFVLDVNNNGDAAGYYRDVIFAHGFVYSGGTFTVIENPNAQQGGTRVVGINDSGTVIGNFFTVTEGFQGFVYDGATYTTIAYPIGARADSATTGINNAGTVVGQYRDEAGTHGYIYENAMFTTVDHPDAPGATFLTAINDDGAIAGYYQDAAGTHSFIAENGVFTTVDHLPAGAELLGLNNMGAVSGTYGDGAGNHGFLHDFLYGEGGFASFDYPGTTGGTFVFGLNDLDQIAGYYDAGGMIRGFIATPQVVASVSAPGALSLMTLGLGVMVVVARRRRAAASPRLSPAHV